MTARTIKLYGALGKKYGRTHSLHVKSVGEAVRLLSANFSTFKQDIVDSKGIAGYEVWDSKHNLSEKQDDFSKEGNGVIKIIPRVIGAGNVAKIIVGVALVALSVIVPPAGFLTAGMLSGIGAFGVSLALGGVIGLMTKTADGTSIASDSDNTQSYLFSGTVNTTKQGNPVFIAYGKHLLGSQVVSTSLTTADVAI